MDIVSNIRAALHSDLGGKLISILLGFGLATLFRQSCNGSDCIVITRSNQEEASKYVYKIDEECYTYTPYVTPCTKSM